MSRRGAVILALLVVLWALPALAGPPGQVLGDFTFTSFDGTTYDSRELRGTPIVISLLATWCKPCRTEAPRLEDAYQTYRDRGVLFLGVFIKSRDSAARGFVEKYGMTFPSGHDNGIAKHLGHRTVPCTVFVGPDGIIRKMVFGPVSREELEEGIAAILE